MSAECARVLLFTGKGGVGKTTTASATAMELASRGHRVVVTSADPAHSLADVFAVRLGCEPLEVAPGCFAQQVDALDRMEESWGDVRSWLVELLDWAGLSVLEAEELAVLPGLEELVALMEIESLARSGSHDVVVVDCAPTAETIRLLSLPDVLDWYIRRAFPASRRLTRIAGPILAKVSDVPMATPEVFDAVERFHAQLISVRGLLTDDSLTTARIVVTPEQVVLAEARRTFTYLSMFGYHTDAVVVNRLLPQGTDDPFLGQMVEAQQRQMLNIAADFQPLRVVSSPHAGGEIIGTEPLSRHGSTLWGGVDPLEDLSPGAPVSIRYRDDHPVLVISLPNTSSEEIDLASTDGDLAVAVGPYRRNLSLPSALRGRRVMRAEVADDELCIEFGA